MSLFWLNIVKSSLKIDIQHAHLFMKGSKIIYIYHTYLMGNSVSKTKMNKFYQFPLFLSWHDKIKYCIAKTYSISS